MIDSKAEIYSVPGLSIETIIDNYVYIVRGYPKGGIYPSEYETLIMLVEHGDSVFAKGFLSVKKWRIDQMRNLLKFLKNKGTRYYYYERSDGVSFTVKCCAL